MGLLIRSTERYCHRVAMLSLQLGGAITFKQLCVDKNLLKLSIVGRILEKLAIQFSARQPEAASGR